MPLAVTTRAHSERCAGEYGFPTRAGPALEPHAAGTKREGGRGARNRERARKRAQEARSSGPALRHKRHRAGTSIVCEGSAAARQVTSSRARSPVLG